VYSAIGYFYTKETHVFMREEALKPYMLSIHIFSSKLRRGGMCNSKFELTYNRA
jgi:hypothetical protein